MKHLKKLLAISLLLCWKMGLAQWLPQPLPTGLSIQQMNFLSDHLGYGLLHEVNTSVPHVQKTTDGGATWTDIPFPTQHPELQSIHFYADSQGVAVFRNLGTPSPNPTKIYVTTDDGANWQEITPDTTATGMGTAAVHFVDRNIGFVATDQYIYATTDGGTTWRTQQLTGYPTDIHFIDADHGTVGLWDGTFNYLGGMMSTTDGGQNWTTTWLTEIGSSIKRVKQLTTTTAFAHSNAYLPTNQSKFYWTTDNGASWDTILGPAGAGSNMISGVDFRNLQEGVLALSSFTENLVFATQDGGTTWTFQDTLPYFTVSDIALTPTTGYLGGNLEIVYKLDVANAVSPAIATVQARVFPNPVRGAGLLRWESDRALHALTLTDLHGRTVWSATLDGGQSEVMFPSVAPGIYVLRLQGEAGAATTKLLVE